MKDWVMIHKIKALFDNGNGCSIKAITKELKISRNTVRTYLRMDEEAIAQRLNNTDRQKSWTVIFPPLKNYWKNTQS